jgi:hypothetical protein
MDLVEEILPPPAHFVLRWTSLAVARNDEEKRKRKNDGANEQIHLLRKLLSVRKKFLTSLTSYVKLRHYLQ